MYGADLILAFPPSKQSSYKKPMQWLSKRIKRSKVPQSTSPAFTEKAGGGSQGGKEAWTGSAPAEDVGDN